MTRLYAIIRSLLEHQWLPCGLALAAVVLMLPALSVGLVWDDLIQRPNQFKPAALPPLIRETGFVANNSGELGTVMQRQFAYLPDQKSVAQAKNYGIAPWWVSDDLRLALWRPVTAFTHWLDYRLYPDSLALMHVQNIAWFAVAVFLAATLYRRIEAVASDRLPADKRFGLGPCIAGLAACLWLLDKNTYIPVAYVANRGFFISLVFGFLCLHAHVHWRTGKSRAWMGISAGCLLLSLLADEGGASTLAFLMAYALVLEPGRWLARLASLLPAALVMVAWRVVYVASGFGVRHLIGYIDPGYAPVAFLERLVPRANALLGGQLTGLPPEFLLAFNPTWQVIWGLIFAGFSLICAIAFLPWLRRDAAARFWAAVMLLALVPAATVIPISKNLGFVAFGAFGLVATFFIGLAAPAQRSLVPRWLRAPAWALALVLVIAHVVLPAACRIGLALGSPSFPRKAALASDHDPSWDIGDRDIVVINDPAGLSIIVPFYRAYRNEPLPRSTHILVPGSTVIEVSLPDASTLVLKAKDSDLFGCPDLGPVHLSYACKAANDLFFGPPVFKAGDRITTKLFVAEVLEVSPSGRPVSMAFHFGQPLESSSLVWLYFDWRRGAHEKFVPPPIGQTVAIAAPHVNLRLRVRSHLAKWFKSW